MIEMKIVPRIREVLAETGRTQAWLSDHTGLVRETVCRIISGRPVSLETAFLISSALGVSIESLWKVKEVETNEEA